MKSSKKRFPGWSIVLGCGLFSLPLAVSGGESPSTPAAAVPLRLQAVCGRSGELRFFRARLPGPALGGADSDEVMVRPLPGEKELALVQLRELEASEVSRARPSHEEEKRLQPLYQEQGRIFQELSQLQQKINAFEELRKDPQTKQEVVVEADRRLAELRGKMEQLQKRQAETVGEIQKIQKRSQERDSKSPAQALAAPPPEAPRKLEVIGLYHSGGTAHLELVRLPSRGEEARALGTFSVELAREPAEDPELGRLWGGTYAGNLAGTILTAGPAADLGFHRHTISRLRERFHLSPEDLPRWFREVGDERFRPQADLYSVTTGSLAIEESLQTEVMLRPTERPEGGESPPVALASLQGPKIKSHPFEEMLRGRTPRFFETAGLVPEVNWYAHFSTIGAEIRLSDFLDQWGTSFLQAFEFTSRDRKLKEKLLSQLAIDLSVLTRLFGDLVIGELALTGSDPYLHDGSDLALILRVKNRPLFEKQMARYREEAKARRTDARESTEVHREVAIEGLSTPDRRLSSYRADLGDFRVYANSLPALKRIIDVRKGALASLAQAKDFLYLRTIFPGEPASEDGFLYLSDRFIREVVGPAQKIGRLHQARCLSNLRSLEFAWIEHRLESGPAAGNPPVPVESLVSLGLLDSRSLRCPSGGRYGFQPGVDGPEAVCSVHNRMGLATPLLEVGQETAGASEADGYRQFVQGYEQYWSRYFDPVGIRFKIGPGPAGGLEAETCILPLIENSIYNGLREAVGGAPVRLTGAAGPRCIGGLSLKIPRNGPFLAQLFRELDREGGLVSSGDLQAALDQLGDGITLSLHDGDLLFTISGREVRAIFGGHGRLDPEMGMAAFLVSAITLPVSISVDVKNTATAKAILQRILDRLVEGSRRQDGWRTFEMGLEAATLEPYRGVEVGLVSYRLFIVNFHLHYAFIEGRLVAATQRWIITDLIDGLKDAAGKGPPAPEAAPEGEISNLLLRLLPQAQKRMATGLGLAWQAQMRDACFMNFPGEELLREGLGLAPAGAPAASLRLFGYRPFCPAGGEYALDPATGRLACSVHRSPYDPRQPLEAGPEEPAVKFLQSLRRVQVSLRFTEEGIRTRILLERDRPPAGAR
jgi:hypothetical protein